MILDESESIFLDIMSVMPVTELVITIGPD